MANNEKAVLQTILYADIFDYPLTIEEIWQFLIIQMTVSRKDVLQVLEARRMPLVKVQDFFCLKGREAVVRKRLAGEKESKKKLVIARRAAKLLSSIQTISFIGISGGLAMNNADEDDDIDLFIITRQNTVWLTRLFSVFLLRLFGLQRKRTAVHAANTICTNFFLDETELAFLPTDHDLYTAHEIVQMKPLLDRENTYQRFLFANGWVLEIMPNSLIDRDLRFKIHDVRKEQNKLVVLFEHFVKTCQLWYMRNHKTIEITTNTKAAFHPFNYRNYVLSEFAKRSKLYKI